jgi:hypothetical protein
MPNSVFRARKSDGAGANSVTTASSPLQPRPAPVIETLEERVLFFGHNAVVTQEDLIGPEGAISSIVLTFNEHLNAASADNPAAYQVIKQVDVSGGSGGLLDSLDPFGGGDSSSTTIVNLHVKLVSAVYDDANMTVTLTPNKPFRADKVYRLVRVAGVGPNAILTSSGQGLDGAGLGKPSNASIYFRSHNARTIGYTDSMGDRVTLRLKGPGQLRTVIPRTGALDPLVFVVGGNPTTSMLTGTVKKSRHGTGIAVIQELSGSSFVQNTLANNPAFDIEATQP